MRTTTINIACYGTKATKDKAEAAGKDPTATFTAKVPDTDVVGANTTLTEVAKAFADCYGVSEDGPDAVMWFLGKCIKHLCDKHRADYHRPAAAPTTKVAKALTSAMTPDEVAEYATATPQRQVAILAAAIARLG